MSDVAHLQEKVGLLEAIRDAQARTISVQQGRINELVESNEMLLRGIAGVSKRNARLEKSLREAKELLGGANEILGTYAVKIKELEGQLAGRLDWFWDTVRMAGLEDMPTDQTEALCLLVRRSDELKMLTARPSAPDDTRPAKCRKRLKEEGKPIPVNGFCEACSDLALTRCDMSPSERRALLREGCDAEARPANCRMRLAEEGKPYPKSLCERCGGHWMITGCAFPINKVSQHG